MSLMAEMDASLQELAHGEIGKCHFVFSGCAAAGPVSPLSRAVGGPPDGF